MYLEHFGLREPPFRLTPDTDFLYLSPGHQEARNVLLVSLRSGEGFIKIIGEVGTGKTLLCRTLLNELGDDVVTAYLPNPCLSPNTFRTAFADELGVEYTPSHGMHKLLLATTRRLTELHAAGKQVVLLVDEAQAMPRDTLEAVRLLSNLETAKTKLLQIVLFAQPELDDRLQTRELRQLRQRITFAHTLRPLGPEDARAYLGHRIAIAGGHVHMLFERAAVDALCRASRGIPRLLNILAHKALMAAYGKGAPRVARAHAALAIEDTEAATPQATGVPALRVGLALGALASAGLYYLLRTAS
ncbi:MAG: AAA family ATPase [Gammaproteobacteria bacterium]|nr:AAA family ATPase [Gammaproteobacteria bacterium]